MTHKTARTLSLLVPLLVPLLCFAQPPAPENAVKVLSVVFAPDTVSSVAVRVHNQGKEDITHLSGLFTYTPYGLRPKQTRCSTSPQLLERYTYVYNPGLRATTQLDKLPTKPADLGTLDAGQDLTFNCAVQPPTKIQEGTATFTPDTVIFADKTWSGDQATAQSVFRGRKQTSDEYGTLMAAVLDCEKATDHEKRCREILAEWLPKTGIHRYADKTVTISSKDTIPWQMPYHRLEAYAAEYKQAAEMQATFRAAQAKQPGLKITPDIETVSGQLIKMMITRDAALSAAYHDHSEAK